MKFGLLILILIPILYFASKSFTNIEPKNEKSIRIPAQVEENCPDIIKNFYTNQSLDDIKKRLKKTKKDPHMFFRSFPPLFYKIVADNGIEEKLGSISKQVGIIGGDIHVENFGVKSFKGISQLAINDFDDLSEGPLVLDLVRHLTSIKLANLKIDADFIQIYLESYLKGLDGKKAQYSEATLNLIEKSKKTFRLDKDKINIKKMKFIKDKKRSPHFEMTEDEIAFWTKAVSSEGKLVDSYKYIKDRGGSGGLIRYELLIEKNNELYWIEAKEWGVPGINAGLNTKPPAFEARIKNVQKYDQSKFKPKTSQYHGKTYLLRAIDETELSPDIGSYSKSEKYDIILDEAYTLGSFHRNFDPDITYSSHVKDLSSSDLENIVDNIYDQINDYHRQ